MSKDKEGEKAAEKSRRQRAHDGEGMDEAFVEDAEDNVDDNQGEDQEIFKALEGRLEDIGGADDFSYDAYGEFSRGEFLDLLER